jgi:hypothetical protein
MFWDHINRRSCLLLAAINQFESLLALLSGLISETASDQPEEI